MIREFLDTWELFAPAYVTGWLAAVLLAFLGVYLVARDQVFLGAVLGQSAACGVAVAGALGGALAHDYHTFVAVALSLATVLIAVGPTARRRPGATTLGAWFVALGAGAIIAASRSPTGMEEVEQVLTSSLLGASDEHIWMLAGLTVVLVPAGFLLRARILLCILDPDAAHVQGARPGPVLGLLATTWAVAAGTTIHAAGLLFAFGMMVLPVVVARRLCRSATAMFVAAPAIAFVATTAAYVLSLSWDLPPGPFAVVLLAVAATVVAVGR